MSEETKYYTINNRPFHRSCWLAIYMMINLSKKGREEVRRFQGKQVDYNAHCPVLTQINLLLPSKPVPGDSWLPCSLSCQSQLRALDPWPLEFYLPLLTTGLSYSHKQPWTAMSHLTFSALMPMRQVSSGILNFRELPHGDLPDSISLITWLLSSRNSMAQKYGSLSHAQMRSHLMCSLVSTQSFTPISLLYLRFRKTCPHLILGALWRWSLYQGLLIWNLNFSFRIFQICSKIFQTCSEI